MTGYARTAPPHITSSESVPKMMWMTAAALVPQAAVSLFFWRFDAVRILGISLLSGLGAGVLARWLFHQKASLRDGSLFVLALLFGLMLPPSTPTGAAAVGSFAAIFLGREIFGGHGANPFHPAVTGLVLLRHCFPGAASTPAPLSFETASIVALGIGGAVLLWQKLIRWEIPLFYLAVLYAVSRFAGPDFPIQFLSGALGFAAFFLVTDPVTTPLTRTGQRMFAAGAAGLAVFLRHGLPQDQALWSSLLIMNAAVPWMDRWVRPKGSYRR